jgi:four helix bundle protein
MAEVRSQESGVKMDEPLKPARTLQDSIVWRKAHEFVIGVYEFSAALPKHETYGLRSQMRRAAVSVPANIAEGFRRDGTADKVRFMNTAEGSLEESRFYLILAQDLGYGSTQKLRPLLEETSRLLNAYSKAIQSAMACHPVS